jgi:hypothetical protein
MEWFAKFVDETIQEYRRKSLSEKKASFLERLEAVLHEQKILPKWSGFLGEKAIQKTLNDRAYTTKLSPGSRSPSDVWGIKEENGVLHIALFQSKASGKNETPQRLTRDEEAELFSFASFVYDQFRTSNAVPEKLKAVPRIVSASYAGISLDGLTVTNKVPIYYGAHCSSILDAKWDHHEKWVRALHTFQ